LTNPDNDPDPERSLELRYVHVAYPTSKWVLGQAPALDAVWDLLKYLGVKLFKGSITGASYSSRVRESAYMRAIKLTFDSPTTKKEVLKAYRSKGPQPEGIKMQEPQRSSQTEPKEQQQGKKFVVSVSGVEVEEETDSGAEELNLTNDVRFSDSDGEDLRQLLNNRPELTEDNAAEFAEELAQD
ncbi:MAG: hypothetical protein GY701_27325, partial [Sulfitobacter sp.]|nr:hypothetical protein [Sulfitobacter sp.]